MRLQLTVLFSAIAIVSSSQQIALTFDDAPLGDGPVFSGSERTSRIIQALKNNNIDQVAFFVVTGFIDSANIDRLNRYKSAGHVLANHSHTHSWIRSIGTANYIKDIKLADSLLKSSGPSMPWYRYPFLDEGRTKSSRDSIRTALKKLGLTNGYVTVDNYDWYLNGAMKKAIGEKKRVNFERMKNVYLDHIWNSIQFYDGIGRKVLNRSPKHVLLLHENDLAALFLDDLIKLLNSKGWEIISPVEAYNDPIATEIPDVLFNGQGRIGAIAFSKGVKPADLVQDAEDEAYLDVLLETKKVFIP
jgi:peptidoglycan-N-acetylglucosamine deacetylase